MTAQGRCDVCARVETTTLSWALDAISVTAEITAMERQRIEAEAKIPGDHVSSGPAYALVFCLRGPVGDVESEAGPPMQARRGSGG